MLGKIPKNNKGVERLAQSLFNSFKYCFCKDSTEKWIKMFGHKRFERIREQQLEDWDNKLNKNFEKKVIDRFTELMLEQVELYKKEAKDRERKRREEEKEKLNKGIKRGKK